MEETHTVHELQAEVRAKLDAVSKKIEEMLPRTTRKRRKKVKTEGPILAEDMGLEAPEVSHG